MFQIVFLTREAIVADQNEFQPLVNKENKDVDITSVAYEKVEQPGPKSLLKQ